MTNKVKREEVPNPYNQKKDWHTEDVPFESSNNLYFEEPSEKNKLFKSNDITEVEAEGSVNVEELETTKDKPYKKPDNWKEMTDEERSKWVVGQQKDMLRRTEKSTGKKFGRSREDLQLYEG